MKSSRLKLALVLSCGLLAAAANAAPQNDHIIYAPIKGGASLNKARVVNLTYHNGPTITSAKVVLIFWGPSFATGGADNAYATTLQAFRNQYGTTGEFNVITQYSGILLSNLALGTADWFDTTTPPANVTDAIVQSEVNAYLTGHGGNNTSTIYEVVTPSTSYSSSGTSTSCGGPHLAYCAYHSWIGSGATATKYSIQPWPGCSGCQVAGWTNVQNQEHFMSHETREAVTDPAGTGWFDKTGNEADDKCAWTPTPFFGTGGFGYQYEWSNLVSGCVKTR
ncbi:MAG TPA: hypothetical protein VGK45_06015 [Thermoanaerobaculia bacterium]|jgi:hypothetical protein